MICPKIPVIFAIHFSQLVLAAEYLAYPLRRTNLAACWSTTDFLIDTLGPGKVTPYTSLGRGVTEFWLLQADERTIINIVQDPGIKAIQENSNLTQECEAITTNYPTAGSLAASKTASQVPESTRHPIPGSVIIQPNAPQDLDLVSWSVVKPLPWKMNGYVYDVNFGIHTYLYVIDNGLNPLNNDFGDLGRIGKVEWHYGYHVNADPTDDSNAGHGSCVASKAAGWINGVSKNSVLVMLKASMDMADTNWAFAKALDDILVKSRQGKAVVVYPRSSTETPFSDSAVPPAWLSVKQLIQDLMDNDVVVVTCAGDDGTSKIPPWKFPALWSEDNYPLIVAGAVGADGGYTAISQGRNVPNRVVWAPGESVLCATGKPSRSPPFTRIGRGSSFSAGMVAGLAAYFLGHQGKSGSVAIDMRKNLLEMWSRPIVPRRSPNVIWNGQDGSNFQSQNVSGSRLAPQIA